MNAPDHRLVLPSTFESVSVARTFVATQLDGLGSTEIVKDLQLATSELVTNAIEHGQRGVLTVDITVDGDCVRITVTSTGPSIAIDEATVWKMAPATAIVGRGLSIVRALADHVWLNIDGERLSVTLERQHHVSPPRERE